MRPRIARPYMPGYGLRPAGEGTGLLPWSWAEKRLESSHDLMLTLENTKYSTNYGIEMLDPVLNSCFRVRPLWAFGLQAGDFTGSPTRWDFES